MKYTIYMRSSTLELKKSESSDEVVEIKYSSQRAVMRDLQDRITRREVNGLFRDFVNRYQVSWITPGYQECIFDLGKLRNSYPEFSEKDWLVGKIAIQPEFETFKKPHEIFLEAEMKKAGMVLPTAETYECELIFTIEPEIIAQNILFPDAPIEIQESLKRFKLDFNDPRKVAFQIMRFGETIAHNDIDAGIKEALKKYSITGIRADESRYHKDLYYNILTYMHGCGFCIAVFERIEEESFSPDISFEVGYMMALRKPVCILKDKTLKFLHSDLGGKLYSPFDPLNAGATIQDQIHRWLQDEGLTS